LLIYNIDRTG